MFGTFINLLFLNNLIKGFYMKGIRALCLWFLLLPAGVASAQLVEKVLDIFNEDSLGTVVAGYGLGSSAEDERGFGGCKAE